MAEAEIRDLRLNVLALVARAAAGESITITDRKRPVAQLTPIRSTRLDSRIEQGRARPAQIHIADLAPPEPGPDISAALAAMRDDERY